MVWDVGYLKKRNIDPKRWSDLYYGTQPYELFVIGNTEQGAQFIAPGHEDNGKVFSVWRYGEPMERLETLMSKPPEDQHHRVFVTSAPSAVTSTGKAFFRLLRDVQEDYPEAIMHVHGVYGHQTLFGLGYRSIDLDARTQAAKGSVVLPTGKIVSYERAPDHSYWLNLLGTRPHELKVPRNRCLYNMKSALWAAVYFQEAVAMKAKGFAPVDPDDPSHKPVHTRIMLKVKQDIMRGDKFPL
jgi:hypothetical protein